ncbi:tail tape measure protein [Paenibacillus alvei]|uniref:Tail tape measure protein n=1 Tax=Paenibacillus alvei TaxID=44250 RepID=A0ABT4GX10_PAEAL|nr:tail tape measure protein [Paenibacillus alvei]MCY9734628.1 tail tape measure protein [Paenibacillus alvei]MCY9755354.1 tail tape measure protein [Paenibacillus alvei]MCY9761246.1 tail tape measure protein [Paenibacillus alvei]MCY9765709.1 tail tape measure protein [Paenibacillus alvei]
MDIIATARVTVPFEARDLISGAVRNMRSVIQGATDDLLDFRRASGNMFDDFVSGGRRARETAEDLGRRVNDVRDETRRLGNTHVDDLFRRARRGADDLRSSVNRAEGEIRGMSDARVHLRARDDVSPVLDGISSKIGAIAATAGTLILGSGVNDAMFGGVMDYHTAAARSAAFLSPAERAQGLGAVDELYKKGLIASRAEGASQLAAAAPLVQDKSKISDFVTQSAKMQTITPDASSEEINRALAQSADTFRESYQSVADSMMYAYKMVGDRQQDLYDTFWEYSGYFKNTGASSAQMSNFLVRSVADGSFNFDKPADFFKEVFGVKALDSGDMTKYFEQRGSGKEEAERQAEAFTGDINSGNQQRMKGALTALLADLASQSTNDLKQSLVMLGSATAEDNGIAAIRNFGTAFEKAPSGIAGTTDRMVQAQMAANPMQDMIETRRQMDLQMQEIGANVSTAALPMLKEFNSLLTEKKDAIQSFGTGIADFVSGITNVYKDHFNLINGALKFLVGAIVVKKLFDFGKGIKNFYDDLKKAGQWVSQKGMSVYGRTHKGWEVLLGRKKDPQSPPVPTPADRLRGRQLTRFQNRRGSRTDVFDSVRSFSSMTIQAGRVFVNGSLGGNGGGIGDVDGRGSGRRGGGRRGGGRGSGRGSRLPGSRETFGRDNGSGSNEPIRVRRAPRPDPIPDPTPPKRGFLGRVKDSGLFSPAKGLARSAGILGAVTSAGIGAYNMYESAKDVGWREAASTQGGAAVGGIAGGAILGAVGSIAGPVGSMVGASIGNYVGEKLGSWADSSGFTRKVVDSAIAVKDTVVSWTNSAADSISGAFGDFTDWIGITESKTPEPPPPPPKAEITFGNIAPEAKKRIEEVASQFTTTLKEKGWKEAFNGVMDQPEVKNTMQGFESLGNHLSTTFSNMWKGGDSQKAKQGIDEVGTAAQQTATKTKSLGDITKSCLDLVFNGAKNAGIGLTGVGASAKSAADETKQHLSSIQSVVSQSSSWGSNLISMMTSGIRSKFPSLTSAVSEAAGVIKNFLGFHSPTKEGPARESDQWAGNFVSMFAGGLDVRPIRDRATMIAGALRPPMAQTMPGSTSGISSANTLSQGAGKVTAGQVMIQNVTFDFGEMAKNVTNFTEFAKMLTSSEGRALIRKVFGEELYKAIENGG